MEKDAYYFSHDSNARFDNKIIKLRAKYGLEGYGFYFCLLEIMRDNSDYTISYDDIDTISFQLQIDCSKAKAMLDACLTFGLFFLDDNLIYSESLLNRMDKMNKLRAKRQEAGRKGGNAKAMLKQNCSIKGKEKKEKEKKENENNIKIKTDPFINPNKTYFESEYKKVFGQRPMLMQNHCTKLFEICSLVDLKEVLPEILLKLKGLNFEEIDFKPTASWLLSDDNFSKMLEGQFDKKTKYKKPKPIIEKVEEKAEEERLTPEQLKEIREKAMKGHNND